MMEHSTAYSSIALQHLLGGIAGRFVDLAESGVHHAYGAIDERFAHIEERRHVGDFFANQAEVGDDFVERLALLGVADRVLQRNAATAHAHRAELEAAHVQNVESDDVAFADFAEQIF